VVPAAVAALRAAAFVAAAVEHLHGVGDDLGAVLLHARFLVVPAIGADRALDVDELPLLQILAADLAELAPGGDVVPLRALLLLAGFVGELLVRGHREAGHRSAAGGGTDLRVFAQTADEDDFVDHGWILLTASEVISAGRAAGAPAVQRG